MKDRALLRHIEKITADNLLDLYITQKKSVPFIAAYYECSQNKINYWLEKYEIPKRTISDAIYDLKNPLGDPFSFSEPLTLKQGILFGMGLGLYWGEGTKRGEGGMRISNTDVKLLRKFIEFLETFFHIDRNKLKFSIQIFDDIDPEIALEHWQKDLGMKKEQFYKVTILKVRGPGTYKYKSEYGVVIVQFNNIKLKKLICDLIEKIQ